VWLLQGCGCITTKARAASGACWVCVVITGVWMYHDEGELGMKEGQEGRKEGREEGQEGRKARKEGGKAGRKAR